MVRWYRAFEDRGHLCLEFEQLDKSLYHLLKKINFQPLPLKEIRPIVQQVCAPPRLLAVTKISSQITDLTLMHFCKLATALRSYTQT